MKRIVTIVILLTIFVSVFSFTVCLVSASETDVYPDVSVQMIKNELTDCVSEGHPYLFGRKQDFENVAENIKNNKELSKRYEAVKLSASHALDTPPSSMPSSFPNGGYLDRGFNGVEIVMQCSFVWLVEGDKAYAQRAYEEALYFANLSTWGTYQSISNNQAALAVAICYDWLYEYLEANNPSGLNVLKTALVEKHLDYITALFADPRKNNGLPTLYFNAYYDTIGSNHCAISNGATAIQAIAIADESNLDYCSNLICTSLSNMHCVFDNFMPDGGWYEGLSYWSFTAPAVARMLSGFESAFGTAFGYENMEHILSTCYFPCYAQTELGYFRYADVSVGKNNSPEKFYFAKKLGDLSCQKFLLQDGVMEEDSPLVCLWYDPDVDYSNVNLKMDLDRLFSNINMAVMRNSWNTNQEIFAGFKVPTVAKGHGNMDAGTFVLDALGERWVTNPGEDSYSLPGYWEDAQDGRRWNYYSKRAEANSCLVINPSLDGGQNVDAVDYIDEFVSEDGYSYAVSDLTETYCQHVSSYKRGAALIDDRSRFMVRDEVKLLKPSDVYSFVNVYQAEISIVNNGKDAILSKNGKNMYVKIISDVKYTLSSMEAKALETSPPRHEGEFDYTEDYQKLALYFEDVSAMNVTMIFIPFLDECEISDVSFDNTPINEWGTSFSSAKFPRLSELYLNGEKISDFDPNKKIYDFKSPASHIEIEAKSDNPDAQIEVEREDYCYKITIRNDYYTNVYKVNSVLTGEVIADTHIGGSVSVGNDDNPLLIGQSKNYGNKELVVIRDAGRYSSIAYYKLRLPELEPGYEYKKVTLVLNQYRILGTTKNSEDNVKLYSVPDTWNELELTYNNAPLRHTFDTSTWYPFLYRNSDGTYTKAASELASEVHSLKHTYPKGTEPYQDNWDSEEYDITAIAEDGEFSFVMAAPKNTSASDYITASKEHSDESLRPVVYATVGKKDDVSSIYTSGVEFISVTGNRIDSLITPLVFKATTFAGNDTGLAKDMTICLASYNNRIMTGISLKKYTVPVGGTELVTDYLTIDKLTDKVQAFVITDNMTPLIISDKSKLEVGQ